MTNVSPGTVCTVVGAYQKVLTTSFPVLVNQSISSTKHACNFGNVTNVPGKLSTDTSTVMNIFATPTLDLTLDSSTTTPTILITTISEESTVKTTSSPMIPSLTEDKTAPELSASATNGFLMLSTNTNPSGANLDIESGPDLPPLDNSSLPMNVTSAKLVLHAVKLTLTTILCAVVTLPKVQGSQSGPMTVLWTAVTTVLTVGFHGSVNTTTPILTAASPQLSPNTAPKLLDLVPSLSSVTTLKWMLFLSLMPLDP